MKNRTDMAIEQLNNGFKYDVDRMINGINFKKIKIDKSLSNKINKKEGIYYTLENIDYYNKEKDIIKLLVIILSDYLLNLGLKKNSDILIVGLGNELSTPDSLGPLVINKIEVNKHLNIPKQYNISALCPSVMGKTGMESKDIIQAIVDEFKPSLVIVIDSLACRDVNRMCNSIQISTAGINPGSGIYNFRREISKQTLGIDVLAIGVPTVTDIDCYVDISDDYFVTPKDIDFAMDIISGIIANSINKALKKENSTKFDKIV